jgi:hypothetical protein
VVVMADQGGVCQDYSIMHVIKLTQTIKLKKAFFCDLQVKGEAEGLR